MSDLHQTCALGGLTPRVVCEGAFRLVENDRLALVSLALRRGAKLPMPFGLQLPPQGSWTSVNRTAAFGIGENQWMLERVDGDQSDFVSDVAAEAPNCSITDQTDGFAGFEVESSSGEGPLLALMSRLVNIDGQRFAAGSATRTGLHHMSVFVIRRAPNHVAFLGMRSAAESLWNCLETAIRREHGRTT